MIIIKKKYDIAVIGGAGHIGLPLSVFLQNKGNQVLIVDPNQSNISKAKKGIPPFIENNFESNIKEALKKGLNFTENIKEIKEKEFIFVTIGSSSNTEDIKLFDMLINEVISTASKDTKIILRSTLSPETFETLKKNKIIKSKNLKLAYCPERIAEGLAFEELEKIPQIIGCEKKDSHIFKDFFQSNDFETLETDIKTAIFIKLFTNAYRYASFSLINEFNNIANDNNLDFNAVLDVATYKYDRLRGIPLPGFIGGPCLIKDMDTFIKSYEKDNNNLDSFFKTNTRYLEDIVNNCKVKFKDKKIIQLGLTFKPGSDDLRSSLSLNLRNELIREGFKVYSVDPFVESGALDFEIFSFKEVKNKTDNIIISTNHKIFDEIEFKNKNLLIVGRN